MMGYYDFNYPNLTDIYYGGTQTEWAAFAEGLEIPAQVTVHFGDGSSIDAEQASTTSPEETTTTETATTETSETTETTETTESTEPTELTMGDVNADTEVNAVDAPVLLVAAARNGAGSDSRLTEEQLKAADVNADGKLDAADAAIILTYAAAIGSGNPDAKLEDFV